MAKWFWRFSKNFSAFLLFCFHLPLEKKADLHLKNSEYPSLKNDLCQLWLELAQQF
jgi:hypothetical protein